MDFLTAWNIIVLLLVAMNAMLDYVTGYLSDRLNHLSLGITLAFLLGTVLISDAGSQTLIKACLWGGFNMLVYWVFYKLGLFYFGDVKFAGSLGLLYFDLDLLQYLSIQIISMLIMVFLSLRRLIQLKGYDSPKSQFWISGEASNQAHSPPALGFATFDEPVTPNLEFPAGPWMFMSSVCLLI